MAAAVPESENREARNCVVFGFSVHDSNVRNCRPSSNSTTPIIMNWLRLNSMAADLSGSNFAAPSA